MPKSRNILPPRRFWTEAECQLLRERYADTPTADLAVELACSETRILAKANAMGLHKSAALVSAMARERTARPDHGSHATRIQPGTAPWNKGLKGATGTQPGCRATQFKPGAVPATWVPLGSHVVNTDGYLDRKVSDEPKAPRHVRWHPVHRLVWVEANGPVPPGHLVVFKKGMFTNVLEQITLDRLELVTRAENMRRNSVHRYGPEIASLHQLRGAINRQINQRTQEMQDAQ